MKLEDKTIEQITAIFDKEIAELEEEIKHAAEDALAAAKAEAPEAPAAEAVAEAEVADEDAEPATAEAPAAATKAETETAAEPESEADSTDEQPISEEEPAVEEDAGVEQPVVDEVEPADEKEPVVDEDASEEPPVVDENAEPAEEDPADEAEEPEETEDAEPAGEDAETATEPEASAQVKDSNAKAALTAVGYILAIAAICVLSVLCMNLLDKQLQSMKPEIPQDIPQSNLAASLQVYTANEVIAQQAVPQPSLQEIYAMDLRTPSGATEADLKKVTKAGLVGLEDTFLQAEKQYGVNAIFLMSIASLESAHGTMMYRPNNMFGYGGKSYPSKEACIIDVASGLSSKYLRPGASLYGGSPTLAGVNKRYAANPQWYAKVGKYMKSYYDVIAPYHNQNLNKIK